MLKVATMAARTNSRKYWAKLGDNLDRKSEYWGGAKSKNENHWGLISLPLPTLNTSLHDFPHQFATFIDFSIFPREWIDGFWAQGRGFPNTFRGASLSDFSEGGSDFKVMGVRHIR